MADFADNRLPEHGLGVEPVLGESVVSEVGHDPSLRPGLRPGGCPAQVMSRRLRMYEPMRANPRPCWPDSTTWPPMTATGEAAGCSAWSTTVSYTHLRAHETGRNLVCRLLLEKK